MNDHARTLVEHCRQQCPIQPDGGKQIQVEGVMPLAIVKHREAAGGR